MTPEREKLAAAIAALKQAEQEKTALASLSSNSWEPISSAERRVEAAEKALSEAQELAVADMVAARLGREVPKRSTRQELQAELDTARADLDAARAARGELKRQAQDAEKALGWCQSSLNSALSAVIEASPEVSKLLGEIKALEAELIQRYEALAAIGISGPYSRAKREAQLQPPARTVPGLPDWHLLFHGPRGDLAASWAVAVDKLRTDANAPLPGSTTGEGQRPKRKLFG
ncbi:hypothetical protein [Acidocella aromatica]|uniref:Chromosome segregation ATPase n=1 Tax=Acidocella aromatica TaxID=1303579 RepID=A0A840VSN8_9PROT|nr:hypothetical protein [Acidocella aromatica]MBB5374330.1 chromosome segregation ATPase [Acidocella aromatica]